MARGGSPANELPARAKLRRNPGPRALQSAKGWLSSGVQSDSATGSFGPLWTSLHLRRQPLQWRPCPHTR